MAIRLRRRIKLPGGLSLNVGKTGVGVSGGIRGARVGVNSRGTYTSVGVPGTGVSSFQYVGKKMTQKTGIQTVQNKNFSLVKTMLYVVFFPILFINGVIKYLFGLVVKSRK